MGVKKILVVDDDATILDMLKTFLQTKGYEAETALDGAEGLAKVKSYRPDLIILDVMMPRMDGYTFIREIKKDAAFRNLPVIVLTAREMMRDMFVQEGIQDYVMKPFQTEELLASISKYLH